MCCIEMSCACGCSCCCSCVCCCCCRRLFFMFMIDMKDYGIVVHCIKNIDSIIYIYIIVLKTQIRDVVFENEDDCYLTP